MNLNSGRFWLKTLTYGVTLMFITMLTVVALVYINFDAERVKKQIESHFAAQQIVAHMSHAPKPSFWPSFGILIEELTLTPQNETAPLLHTKQLKLELEWLPLVFEQRAMIHTLSAQQLNLNVARREDGHVNFEALFNAHDSQQHLDELDLKHVQIQFHDALQKQEYRLEQAHLHVKHLRSTADFSLEGIFKHDNATLSIQASSPLRLTKNMLYLDKLALQMNGELLGMRGVRFEANSAAQFNFADKQLQARKFQSELIATEPLIHAHAHSPNFSITHQKLDAPKLQIEGTLTQTGSRYNFNGTMHTVALNEESGRVQRVEGQLQWIFGDQRLDMLIDTPLNLHSLEDVRLAPLRLSAQLTSPQLPRREMLATTIGEMRADLVNHLIFTQLEGTLDGEKLRFKAQHQGLEETQHTLSLSLARLDLNRYLPRSTQKNQHVPLVQSTQKLGLDWLQASDIEGDITIGELSVGRFALHNLDFHVSARPEKLEFSPISADIYEGQLSGTLQLTGGEHMNILIDQRLNHMNLSPLLKDLFDFGRLEGVGNGKIQLNAHGKSFLDMSKTLNGTIALNVSQGALLGIDLLSTLNNLGSELQNWSFQRPLQHQIDQKTPFKHLNASFQFTDGIARNQDLQLNSNVLTLSGGGKVDLVENIIDYTLEARVNPSAISTVKNLSMPLKITGALAEPTYSLDFNRLVREKKTDDEKQEAIKEHITQPLKALVPIP